MYRKDLTPTDLLHQHPSSQVLPETGVQKTDQGWGGTVCTAPSVDGRGLMVLCEGEADHRIRDCNLRAEI